MSIQTSAKPKDTNIRSSNSPLLEDFSDTRKKPEQVDIEISLPALFLIILALATLILGGVYLYNRQKSGDNGTTVLPNTLKESLVPVTFSLNNVNIRGESKSGYIFVDFSDFECPYCKNFVTGLDPSTGIITKSTLKNIFENYVDKQSLNYGFVPYIGLESHKPAATNEVIGYYCAKEQGKGQEYEELVYAKTYTNGLGIDQKGTQRDSLLTLVKELKLDDAKFTTCYDNRDIVAADTIQQIVDKEVKTPWTDKFGKQNFGTPFFAICKVSTADANKCEGKVFVGAWPYEDIKGVIDDFIGTAVPTTTN